MKLNELNDIIALVCPIYGINTDGVIWFKPEATEAQKAEAKAIMDQHKANIVP